MPRTTPGSSCCGRRGWWATGPCPRRSCGTATAYGTSWWRRSRRVGRWCPGWASMSGRRPSAAGLGGNLTLLPVHSEVDMPVTVELTSTLPPPEVLRILTDFGPSRADAWPGVDEDHFTVHEQGPDWADVTEGNKTTWERERYSWDAAA